MLVARAAKIWLEKNCSLRVHLSHLPIGIFTVFDPVKTEKITTGKSYGYDAPVLQINPKA